MTTDLDNGGVFSHIRPAYRGKVAKDMLSLLTDKRLWDYERFDPANDYQRHLFALFLKIAGIPRKDIWAKLYTLSVDVPLSRRERYVDEVLYSEIVGFPHKDGSFTLIPDQTLTEQALPIAD